MDKLTFKFIVLSLFIHVIFAAIFLPKAINNSNGLSPSLGKPLTFDVVEISRPDFPLSNIKVNKKRTKTYSSKRKIPSQTLPLSKNNFYQQSQPGVSAAKNIKGSLKPIYPLSSRRRKEEGTAKILVTLDQQGNIIKFHLTRSSGHKKLDQAAWTALERARIQPEFIDKNLATSDVELNFEFRLNSTSQVH